MTNLSMTDLALPARLWLARGKQALHGGKRDEAVAAFRRAVAADPTHIDSWLWLAGFCADPHESLRCLAQVLALDPQSESAHEGIRWARKRLTDAGELDEELFPADMLPPPAADADADALPAAQAMAAPPAAVTPAAVPEPARAASATETRPRQHPAKRVFPHILRTMVLLLLLFIALDGGSITPWNPTIPAAAAAASEDAVDLSVSAPLADLTSVLIPSLSPIPQLVQSDPYELNYARGVELRQQNDLQGALQALQAAVKLDPNAVEARSELAQVKADLDRAAGSPDPDSAALLAARGAKWFDVNLTTQRFRALRGQTTVYTFPTSTGISSMRTVPGRFKILDKISDAYSRIWKLQMPYWMGIYWAGTAENGIHALPINRQGQKIWGNLLGRPSSFGCVILDTKTARLMFNWADIGTPIIIHY